MSELNALFETQVSNVMSGMVRDNRFRLDANCYNSATSSRFWKIKKFTTLGELCDKVFNPPVFKRAFQESTVGGCRYLASAEIMALEPDEVFINEMQAIQLDLKVKTGWILITGFGTIGSVRIVDRLIEDSAVANNVARIVPRDCEKISGFLAAFLSSKIGNTLLNERASGSVVRYIEAPEISNLPIPDLADGIVRKINSKYLKAVKSREISNSRLKEAEFLMYKTNCLHKLSGNDASWFDEERKIESILVNSKDIIRNNHSDSEYRLDARFYSPMAQLAIKNIKKAKTEVKTIDDVTERVFMCNRFKRSYVGKDHGLPFLSGKNIIQIRPTDLKYISVSETKGIDKLKLQQGWTLITRSGTLGRTCFIMGNYENWAATEDIIRVVPDEKLANAGYVYAFLSSEYGKLQILRYCYGSVIDHITPEQIKKVLIPLPSKEDQKQIGDLVRSAYEKRAEAIRLEDDAQDILMEALTQ